jgi:NADP-dependent 3-hydroxy acid dehydrogenase YdfG
VGGGLGTAVAARPGEAEVIVAGTDRSQEKLDALAEELKLSTERFGRRPVDLPDEGAAREWCTALVECFGQVHGLVRLVGSWRGGQPLHEEPLAHWKLLRQALIRTVQLTLRAFHGQLEAR